MKRITRIKKMRFAIERAVFNAWKKLRTRLGRRQWREQVGDPVPDVAATLRAHHERRQKVSPHAVAFAQDGLSAERRPIYPDPPEPSLDAYYEADTP